MRVISRREVIELLSMEACIQVMQETLSGLARGESTQYLRSVYPMDHGRAFALMPGQLHTDEVVGAKIITIFPENGTVGLPSHQGLVTIFDATDGQVKAVMDAQSLTAIRTAAASGVATKVLAREDARVLAILGTGEQAVTHLEAMLAVRRFQEVRVWGRNESKATEFQQKMAQRFQVPIVVCQSAKEAVETADVVCTVTASKVPVLEGKWMKPGAHVNAVGACRPSERELDTDLVRQSAFYVDRLESAVHEAGDYLIPLAAGAIGESHIIGELGGVLNGQVPGRASDEAVTVFESLGIGVEDLASAEYVYREALWRGVGVEVSFSETTE